MKRRSRTPRRSRSPSEERRRRKLAAVPFGERAKIFQEEEQKKQAESKHDLVVTDDMDETAIMAAMGLPVHFDTTQGKQVEGANHHCAQVKTKRKYRQYMNRRGGFNRPLDKVD